VLAFAGASRVSKAIIGLCFFGGVFQLLLWLLGLQLHGSIMSVAGIVLGNTWEGSSTWKVVASHRQDNATPPWLFFMVELGFGENLCSRR